MSNRCNICGEYVDMLPYNHISGRRCPLCDSLERHRALVDLVEWCYDDHSPESVLHFAPEKCVVRYLSELFDGEYRTADIRPGIGDDTEDIQNLTYADNRFDLIICLHVLEHVPDDKAAISELLRVLKPGGFAIIQVPIASGRIDTYSCANANTPELRKIHHGQSDHLRRYGSDIVNLFDKALWEVEWEHSEYAMKPFLFCIKK